MIRARAASVLVAAVIAACTQHAEPEKAAIAASARTPADRTVLGVLTLGQPLNLPRCSGNGFTETCITTLDVDGAVNVRIPYLAHAPFGADADVRLINGVIERVTITSERRLTADGELLEALVAKYGPPLETGVDSTRSSWATWQPDPDLFVRWIGAGLDLDRGVAVVETAKGRALAQAEREQQKTRPRSL